LSDVICECCGSGDTGSSLEKVESYKDKLLVIHCYSCELSYYQEPEITGEKVCLMIKK
jgi:hypothetical protein